MTDMSCHVMIVYIESICPVIPYCIAPYCIASYQQTISSYLILVPQFFLATSRNDSSVHGQLVLRGRAWGAHISETWTILVYVGAYIIFSVGFDITICALLGDAVLAIGESDEKVNRNQRSVAPSRRYWQQTAQ